MFVCLCHVRDIIVFAETETLSPKTFPSAAQDISRAHVKVFSFPVWETRLGEGQQSVCLGGEEGEILGEDRQTPVRLGGGGGGGKKS